MPSSPRTPMHSRQPSALDFSPSNMNLSRRLSKSSIHTPTTPNHMIRDFSASVDSVGMDVLGSAQNGGNGLGNLADELADAWSEDEGEELEEGDLNFQNTTASDSDNEDREGENNHPVRDSGVDVTSPKKQQGALNPNLLNLTPPVGGHGRVHALGHARTPSEYDGSDYGGDSDLESPAFGPALLARMDMVEGLARRGTENNGSQADGVVKRVIESLRDLGVAEMRRDEELREEGEQWVESGDWQKRLGDRECAGVCRGVVGGFEQLNVFGFCGVVRCGVVWCGVVWWNTEACGRIRVRRLNQKYKYSKTYEK
ncbi:hypothetical protein SS1G_07483 [Sclerotinia sclerotiorum 1980 UF-70]|uniref:Uncharacterized protein n=1 Tax=Sclerotinia sclerotiorum (strain ATCC 18683 / 1980 / Ss-1) TaxID=665079 RepID=A7EQ83_SCLS1|nr:hypothetical protein SS1G_07483 [Sclerotinia sclerotiorum 1980 UF-70]EDO04999.1 hypothetical protein SS1G_07483 [Sclerotinia sclerotiorum 1980 UF-70]